MRVLVVGAAGFLGQATVAAFARAGHDVVGMVRRPEQDRLVQALGGAARRGDLFDAGSLTTALEGCDLAIHLAQTDSPELPERRRVRVDGAERLVAALRAAHVSRLIVGSGYWVYPDTPGVITETTPVAPRSISQVNFDTEEVARRAAGPGGLEVGVVRPGMVYGDGSWFRSMVDELRAGTYRYIVDGSNILSPIHWSDCGDAFRVVAEHWSDGGLFLAVDDEPVSTRAFAEFVSTRLGSALPTGISVEAAAREWGDDLAALNLANRRVSNERLRSLGWEPKCPTYRDGVPGVLEAMGAPSRAGT